MALGWTPWAINSAVPEIVEPNPPQFCRIAEVFEDPIHAALLQRRSNAGNEYILAITLPCTACQTAFLGLSHAMALQSLEQSERASGTCCRVAPQNPGG